MLTDMQYAQRATMKALRYIKIRTLAQSPVDVALGISRNRLKVEVLVEQTFVHTLDYLYSFRQPLPITSGGVL
jgi:hypothetical protein